MTRRACTLRWPLALVLACLAFDAAAYFPTGAALAIMERAANKQSDESFCISVDGRAPSAVFLRELRKRFPRAAPDADCRIVHGAVVNRTNGEPAAQVALSDFRADSPTHATAKLTTYAGPLAGSWRTVTLVLVDGHWQVEDIRLDIIS